jgi:hypothetical protein
MVTGGVTTSRKKKSTTTAGVAQSKALVTAAPKLKTIRPSKPLPPPKATVDLVCSKVNPFCDESNGSRILDEFEVPTQTFQTTAIVPLVTGADGVAGFSFWPSADCYCFDNTTPAGYNYTLPNGPSQYDSAAYNSISTSTARLSRLVSAGITYFNTMPSTSFSGFTEFGEIQAHSQDSSTIASGGMRAVVSDTIVQDLREPFTFVARPCASAWKDFYPPSLTINPAQSLSNTRWVGCVAVFSGAPNTTLGFIRIVRNLEYTLIVSPSQLQSQTAQKPSYSLRDPQTEQAVSSTFAQLKAMYAGTTDTVDREVRRYAVAALGAAIGYASRRANRLLLTN